MIAAFVPSVSYAGGLLHLQGLVMFAMYLVGIVAAIGVALALKRTVLSGPTPPFVMELPSYKIPSPKLVFYRMFDRGWAFLQRAGTLILAVSILIWAALYYPRNVESVEGPYREARAAAQQRFDAAQPDSSEQKKAAADLQAIEQHIAGEYQRQSYLGRAGHFIEPIVRPLGWDWRVGCAAIASFPAREVVVATLGILYDVGNDLDVENDEDRSRLQEALYAAKWEGTERRVFTLASALSLMVFFALCAQCAATLAVIKRETNSWRWPAFAFVYMTSLAYVAAFATYQAASALGA
jgi:ferrous iron transport protein B